MALADIYSYIETQIKAVSGVDADTVHKFPRHTNSWAKIYEIFKDDSGNLNTWLIRFMAAPAEWTEHKAYRILRTWTFEVWFMYSLKDATPSNTAFEDMVEGVLNKLSLDPAMNDSVDLGQPAQLINIDEVMFVDVLCHRAQLQVSGQEQLDPSA